MFLIPAKEVVVGDLILSKEPVAQRRTVFGIDVAEAGHIGLSHGSTGHTHYYLPHEEVLVIRRGTPTTQTHEERADELIGLTKALLACLEIDRDDDCSTDFLISMAGTAHRLKEKLEEAYCNGEHPCFPSGNREPAP